jgi:hypothetical protein
VLYDAVRNLHQLAHAVVSGQVAWPASPGKTESIWQMLADSGLTEKLADGTTRYTDLDATGEIELLIVCIGAICPWDIPFFLEKHGYASEEEALEVWEAETDVEGLRLLKLLILRAYANRFVGSTSSH